MLKALPEQQGFTMKPLRTYESAGTSPPKIYDEEQDLYGRQQRTGTIPQPILGLMRRRQAPNDKIDRRVVGQRQPIHLPSAHYMPSPYGTIMVQGPRQLMTGDTSDDELTDAAQRKRGSVFDAGHYNKYGYPMVGVAQGDFSPEYRVSNYNKLPE